MKSRARLELVGRDACDRQVHVGNSGPASVTVADVVNPSGAHSWTAPLFGPSTDTLSLISWPPLLSTTPPRNTASASVPSTFLNSDS